MGVQRSPAKTSWVCKSPGHCMGLGTSQIPPEWYIFCDWVVIKQVIGRKSCRPLYQGSPRKTEPSAVLRDLCNKELAYTVVGAARLPEFLIRRAVCQEGHCTKSGSTAGYGPQLIESGLLDFLGWSLKSNWWDFNPTYQIGCSLTYHGVMSR